jgi:hypothetical protein
MSLLTAALQCTAASPSWLCNLYLQVIWSVSCILAPVVMSPGNVSQYPAAQSSVA